MPLGADAPSRAPAPCKNTTGILTNVVGYQAAMGYARVVMGCPRYTVLASRVPCVQLGYWESA
jgi:hypothetical protein